MENSNKIQMTNSQIHKSNSNIKIINFGIVFLIVFLTIFMRFFRLAELFPFDLDTEYISQLGYTIAHDFHIIWIGVSAGATNYYLGPGYIYLTGLLLKLSKDPLILGFAASSIGLITIALLYTITSRLYEKKTALFATILYAASAYAALFDRRWWPPPVGLMALLFLFVLELSRKNARFLIIAAFLAGVSLHIHISLVLFFPFILFVMITQWRRLFPWILPVMIGAFVLATLPQLVYDNLHNWDNWRAPIGMIIGNGTVSVRAIHELPLQNILSRFWNAIATPGTWSTYGFAMLSLLSIVVSIFSKKMRLVGIMAGMYLLVLLLFPGPVQEYYGATILPLLAICIAYTLTKLPKPATIGVIVIFIFFNVLILTKVTAPYSYAEKQKTVQKIIQKTGKGNPVLLDVKPSYRGNGGWHYMLFASDIPVVAGASDEFYRWIYAQYMDLTPKPKYTVIINGNELFKITNLKF